MLLTNGKVESPVIQPEISKQHSRSYEPMSNTGLAMWSDEVVKVTLIKGERGLGFSILDYQVYISDII